MINIKIDIKGMKEVQQALDPKTFQKVITRTMNKTADQARIAATRQIRKEYNIKASRIREGISTTRATWQRPVVIIRTKGRPPGLQHYDARSTKKGVTVKVKGVRKVVKGGFMPRSITGVYKRTGLAPVRATRGKYAGQIREPIKRLFGPSLPSMMKVVGVPEIERVVNEQVQKIFEHELEWEQGRK
ncbi:MAG: hypothetical protein IT393_07210 [Nitrospirae bacterium]|nr:hypothetical protein [Nitrospirota bacterium]